VHLAGAYEQAAGQLVEIEARDIIDGGGEHVEPRRFQIVPVASLK
jgi:hypothetical protein